MVSTQQIKAALPLQPFIACYSLRRFDTGDAIMPKPLHAVHQGYMSFFLKNSGIEHVDGQGKLHNSVCNSLITLFTEPQGCLYFRGYHELFCIEFKSNGINAIFGIPQRVCINAIISLNDIIGDDNRLLTEQLQACNNIGEMSRIANAYLLKKLLLQKHKLYTNAIAAASNIILVNKGQVSLSHLALHANMCNRSFERKFADEIGVTPKTYARITRFFMAVENKMLHQNKSWTDITYEGGYFDQAHFIKECKEFSHRTPEELFTVTPPPKENFIWKESV